ncbi:MAG: DNA methyltransferase [Conexivisphaerales archaeon]
MIEKIDVYDNVLYVKFKKDVEINTLEGFHKIAISIGEFSNEEELLSLSLKIQSKLKEVNRISVSTYDNTIDHSWIASTLLKIIRSSEPTVKIIDSSKSELQSKDVLLRTVADFVVVHAKNMYKLGITAYVTDLQSLYISTERPVPSSTLSMSPKLARTLVNILNLDKGKLIMDPFCGSGTILMEALLAGLNCIGVDKDERAIKNTKLNIEWLKSKYKTLTNVYKLYIADATKLNFKEKVDGIVTEPILLPLIRKSPNVADAYRMIHDAKKTYIAFLASVQHVVRPGGKIIVVAPAIKINRKKTITLTLHSDKQSKLKEYQPSSRFSFKYPLTIGKESTRWIGRRIYAYEVATS